MKKLCLWILLSSVIYSCQQELSTETVTDADPPFLWENATVYFLLTDRFHNGDTTNDFQFDRKQDGAVLRNFEGGDFAGIIAKLEDGYFDRLGVNALWFNPPVEQVHGFVDEGTGKTYGYHGYWTRDWTAIDPNFGTMEEFKQLVQTAHARGIRVVMDAVVNHTGPVTDEDSKWPDEWVRTTPQCTYTDMATTIPCTLVANLPDIRTESDEPVELPPFLLEKWKAEGRLEQELKELDQFFERTGLPRAPRFYLMKWLTDYVRELGIDGYRVDTAKHTEASVWSELYKLAQEAFQDWKQRNPEAVLDDQDFFMVGEVYGYGIGHGREYPFNETEKVDFYDHGFKSLINFGLKGDAGKEPEEVFSYYSERLHGELQGKTVLNYVASHDDGWPFDRDRQKTFLAGTMLFLTPGQVQLYYGDETGRPLKAEGAEGDANLRTLMNWADTVSNDIQRLMAHWQKLGQFRKDHPAVGAGAHEMIAEEPYTFRRTYSDVGYQDAVVVVFNNTLNAEIRTGDTFGNGTLLTNYYTGEEAKVENGVVRLRNGEGLVLLGVRRIEN